MSRFCLKKGISFLFVFLFFVNLALALNSGRTYEKQIVGYYPNWQWYKRNQLVNPESILYEKYTVINYAFFRPLSSGIIESTDPWADENLLLGPMVWWPEEYNDYTRSLPYLAAQAGVKLLPSIGGWNDSHNFPIIAADPVLRQTFIQSCIDLIETYNFDGIDLDWEYPGYAPHNGSPEDAQNFTLLVQELRNALNDLAIENDRDYLLTSCFGASELHMQNIEWDEIIPYIDMVNLMTYDFHGPWDTLSNHHTPLYPTLGGNPDWCLDGAFTLLTENFNVPPDMINIGVAFYGKALMGCTELYGSHNGYDMSTFPEDEGQPRFYNIVAEQDLFSYYWDDQVQCPYLLGDNIDTFITFDDTLSIGLKAQYVLENNAMGVIIWEITGDYIETFPGSGIIEGTPLLDEIVNRFSSFLPPPLLLEATGGDQVVNLSWESPEGHLFTIENQNQDKLAKKVFSSSRIKQREFQLLGYNVYRDGNQINTEILLETSFLDVNVDNGVSYSYYVTALYTEGESEPSNTVTVVPGLAYDFGDINRDGIVNPMDASIILQYYVGYDPIPEIDPIPWSDYSLLIADVDLNGVIQPIDAAYILQYYVGLIDELPVLPGSEDTADIEIVYENGVLNFYVSGQVLGLGIQASSDFQGLIGQPVYFCENWLIAENISDHEYRIGLARSELNYSDNLIFSVSTESEINEKMYFLVDINSQVRRKVYLKNLDVFIDTVKYPFSLKKNYPNPFNPDTMIEFAVYTKEYIKLEIFNLRGHKIKTLLSSVKNPGSYTVKWSGEDDLGNKVGSGIFFYKMSAGDYEMTHKMIMLK